MTDAGRAVLPDMSEQGFVIDSEILALLQSDEQTWRNFQSFPPLYQRVRVDAVQREKGKSGKKARYNYKIVKIEKRSYSEYMRFIRSCTIERLARSLK